MKNIIVVMDMQPLYLDNWYSPEKNQLIETIRRTVQDGRKQGIPVLNIEYGTQDRNPTLESVVPFADSVFKKTSSDAFCGVGEFNNKIGYLEDFLQETEKILLCGINTSYCIKDTIIGATSAGIKIYTSPDLIADTIRAPTKITLQEYQNEGLLYQNAPNALRTITL